MKFCTITPDRGDRPELLEFCKHQLSRMTIKPDKSYFINYSPRSDSKDLIERIRYGVELAKKEGYEYAYIIENDDYYPADYFENMAFLNNDFVGDPETIYYHVKTRGHSQQRHIYRSSLFTTGFKISALDKLRWDVLIRRNSAFLDQDIWEHARKSKKRMMSSGAIGIKHAIGLCGGRGHKINYRLIDTEEMEYLKSKVDSDAFEFYKHLNKKLNS